MTEPLQKQLLGILVKAQGIAVTPEDFSKSIKVLLELVKAIKQAVERNSDDSKNQNLALAKSVRSEIERVEERLNGLLKKNSDEYVKTKEVFNLSKKFEGEIKTIKDMVLSIDFSDHFSALEEKLTSSINSTEMKIPNIQEIMKAEVIRGKLESLKGDERLDKTAIRGLEEEIKRLENTSRTVIGGGVRKTQWAQQNLTGTIDGVNRAFTFEGKVPMQYSERVFLNYVEMNPLTDYVIAGRTITYTTAPDASLTGLPHIIRYAF
jgi:hypothetical protein